MVALYEFCLLSICVETTTIEDHILFSPSIHTLVPLFSIAVRKLANVSSDNIRSAPLTDSSEPTIHPV
jgi:hypothetical protein